jgi:predicted transcriptional regulator
MRSRSSYCVRTTVDLDERLFERAKRLALEEKKSLSAVVGDALAAYLGIRRQVAKDPPFELISCGAANGKFPSHAEVSAVEEEEERVALAVPGPGKRAAP